MEDLVTKHPMQPIVVDGEVTRFRSNRVVAFLMETARHRGTGLSELAGIADAMQVPPEDWEQFIQLLGYSVSGYCDLSTVSEESKDAAWKAAEKLVRKPVSGTLKP